MMRESPSAASARVWVSLCAVPVVLLLTLAAGPTGWGFPSLNDPAGAALMLLRVNRLLTGFIAGAALSAAGVIFQALFRNPLAEPYVLGVSSGSALGAAAAVLCGWGVAGVFALPLTAFIAGAATLALVYVLAASGGSRRGEPTLYGILLSGVVVSSMASSLLMLAIAFAPLEGMHNILWWMLGSVQACPPALMAVAGGCALAGLAVAVWKGRDLNALSLGRETAHHLGVRTGRVTAGLLAAGTLLAASAVAIAGLIGFVGLIVPHAVRAWAGPDHRRLPLLSALWGGAFLVVCDTVARTLIAPRELPIGVLTALLGGPFFLYLLQRRRRGEGWIE